MQVKREKRHGRENIIYISNRSGWTNSSPSVAWTSFYTKKNKCLTGFRQGFICLNPVKHFFICPTLSTKQLLNQAPSCDMHVTPSCRRWAELPVSTLVSPHPDGGCERSQSGVLMRCPWNQMISTPAKSHKSWWRGRLGTLHSVASHVCYPSAILLIYGAVSISIFYSNLFPYLSCTLACLILCLPTVLLEWLL